MLEAMLESRSRVRVRSGDIYIRQPINELFYAVENGTIHHHCDDDGLRLDEVSSAEREREREREKMDGGTGWPSKLETKRPQ